MDCSVCDNVISSRAPGVTCVCKKNFHAKCVNISKVDLKKITDGVKIYRCGKCSGAKRKSKSAPVPVSISTEDEDSSSVDVDDISDSYSAVIKELKNISVVQKTFENSLNTFSRLIDDFNKKIKKFEKVSKDVEKLSADQLIITKKVNFHEYRLNDNDQISRMNDLEISNLPENKGENLVTIIKTIGVALKVPFTEREIDSIHRVPCFDKSKPKNIIVRLQSRLIKNEIIAAARKYYKENNEGITTNKINVSGNNNIFINEHLTADRKLLLMDTKKYAKANNVQFVWVKDCKIFARKSFDSKTKLIRCIDDIKNI